jgi:glycosidase
MSATHRPALAVSDSSGFHGVSERSGVNAAVLAMIGLLVATAFAASAQTAPVLTVNGISADYTTTHLFVDEVAGDSVPLTIVFSPNTTNVIEADVFSNLNRRDRATLDANGDGVEDGVLPPDGNLIATGDDNNYYKAYAMTPLGNGQYSLTLLATNCGAYRLTARFKLAGLTNWNWYSTGGRRDHAIVVSPKKARSLVLYELNALIVDSQGTQTAQRSTLVDLYNGPGSRPYDPVTNRINLTYAKNLGVNWLWLQPVHPIGIEATVNSPYCVKNYFAVSPLLSKANTRPTGLQELQGFVAAADAAGVNVMLDVPFDHTAHDCELGNSGVSYFGGAGNPGNWQTGDEIRNREPRFYSLTNNYSQRASSATNIAVAPDRGDFPKWQDVYDVFFGVYSALVAQNPQNNTNYLSQADSLDYSIATGKFDYVTQNVWRYFSDVLLYWLDQTGCTNGLAANQTAVGIDGIRADFAEGLPPQAWEYIINKTRTRKWDFVFLAESLGPTNVTFRSSRHFDVVNDSVLYDFRTAATASDYQRIFDARRANYGQCLMLWNSASHDVGGYYSDPFQTLVRYLAGGTIEGVPMIFYGQELGTRQGFGFSVYQNNSEMVPNFLGFNSLQPICAPANRTFNLDQLYSVYAAVGRARQLSPALRSANRYYLTSIGTAQPSIFSIGKYETASVSPNFSDVVFAFVNLDPTNGHQGTFNLNIAQNGSNVFGIQSNRSYNVKNLGAYANADSNRPNAWLLGGGVAGSDLLARGLAVTLNPVPNSNAGWTNAPFEPQYLKLYDVTPPTTPLPPTTPKPYALGQTVTLSWSAVSDPQGGVSAYHVIVGTSQGVSDVFDGMVTSTTLTVSNNFGARLYAQVSAINNADIEGPMSVSSSGTVLVDPASLQLHATAVDSAILLTWSSATGLYWRVLTVADLGSNSWPLSPDLLATNTTVSYMDPGLTNAPRFYRLQLLP